MTPLKQMAWYMAASAGVGVSVTALVLVVRGEIPREVAISASIIGLLQTILCVVAGCYSARSWRKGVSAWI